MTLHVGQKLWFVGAHRHNAGGREVVVSKIGRKWATLEGGDRIDLETLRMDGGGFSSPGRCWISRELWEAEDYRQKLWSEFCGAVYATHFRAPDTVTAEQIARAANLIGFALAVK